MKKLKEKLRISLNGIYPEHEINSLFYMVMEHLTGLTRQQLLFNSGLSLNSDQFDTFCIIVDRLNRKEPIQYILGEGEFYGLRFKLAPGVLIPRGETEELVELIIKDYTGQSPKVLDIGSGSGCIPVVLKKHLPMGEVYSCDISSTALEIAQANSTLNQTEITFFEYDILSAKSIPYSLFDVIVSNPPYVTEKEKEHMESLVLEHEPHLALFVPDNDPLLFYRAILQKAELLLKKGGAIYFEINEAYGCEVESLFNSYGFFAELYADIQGKPRFAKGVYQ